MERYKPYKFEEAIDSIQDFNNLIEGILKDSFDEMVDKFIEDINKFENNYISTRKNEVESPYGWNSRLKIKNYNLQILSKIYIQESPYKEIFRKKDADTLIKIEATKRAKEIQDSYRARLHSKLFLILKNKELKDVKIIKLQLSIFYDATIKFMFKDGSEFILNSQIVLSTSKLGTMFYRFPNIYQNIIMPDGSKIKKQSEEWMLENFANVTISNAKQAKKELDPNFEQKELRKKNSFFNSKMGIKTENGIIEIGNPVKIDIFTLRPTIKDIVFEPKLPELIFVKRADGSDFYSSLDNEIRGKNKYKATIKYENDVIIEIGVTFLAREENMFKTGFNTTSKNIELRPQYREFPSSGYFTSVSGRVIKIIKGVE
jgi:hypothetical protein